MIYHQLIWLTQWCQATHIGVSELTNIGSDNGLSAGRRRAIIWPSLTHIVNLNIGNTIQWNLKGNTLIFAQENAFDNVVCEIAAILPRPQCIKRFRACRPITCSVSVVNSVFWLVIYLTRFLYMTGLWGQSISLILYEIAVADKLYNVYKCQRKDKWVNGWYDMYSRT